MVTLGTSSGLWLLCIVVVAHALFLQLSMAGDDGGGGGGVGRGGGNDVP